MQNVSFKKPVLGIFSLVMINVIAIDNLRALPMNATLGVSLLFFYALAILFFLLPCILVTAELATHYPQTGGAYVWVREAFGPRLGFLTIWLQWIYNVVWYPTILSFIATNLAYLINPDLAHNKIFILSFIIIFFLIATVINCLGMTITSTVSTLCALLGTLLPMTLIIVLGALWLFTGKPLAFDTIANPYLPNIMQVPNLAFFVVILFSLVGIEMSAVHAEEVKNPQKDYPHALYYSGIIIVLSLLLSSLAIASVVPHDTLNIISAMDQAFNIFLSEFHLQWLMPITILLIILGGFGGIAAWVIGSTKGLVVAAEDGSTPSIFSYRNKKGAPVTLLILQAGIVFVISSLFVFIPSISTSYWLLSDLTAQLALFFYIFFFAAAICLRYKTPYNPKAYRIPGGLPGIWLVCGIGILTCIVGILIGFIPPSTISIQHTNVFEMILIGGIITFFIPPLIIYKFAQKKR